MLCLCSLFLRGQNYMFKTDAGTFDVDVIFMMGKDTSTVRKFVENVNPDVDVSFECQSATYYAKGYPIVVWFPFIPKTPYEYSLVNHEVSHVIFSIFDNCEIPTCPETEEVFCYEFQYISKQLLDNIKTIKNGHNGSLRWMDHDLQQGKQKSTSNH